MRGQQVRRSADGYYAYITTSFLYEFSRVLASTSNYKQRLRATIGFRDLLSNDGVLGKDVF